MKKGLTSEEVLQSRLLHGSNTLDIQEDRVFWKVLKEVVLEPMFILLLVACFIYFIVGSISEGIIMLISIFLVASISIYQDYKSRNAVKALHKLSATKAAVMRDGKIVKIAAEEIVVGDVILLEEGEIIAADGLIIVANDLSLNESILTGESFAVIKTTNNNIYKGTLVVGGSATVQVTEVGLQTMFGKIGVSLKEIIVVKTPLQQQIRSFVKNMVWVGVIAFLIVIGFNYYHSGNFVQSFLQGLTLAMSILPEEIPVAFSTFQALGAFRLLKNNIIVKQPQYVETLGSATVICADKTGTITQNKMSVEFLYDAVNKKSIQVGKQAEVPSMLIEYAMWASETNPFDPMEKAIHDLYSLHAVEDCRSQYQQIHEYPLSGKPPMMTHIFKNEKEEVVIAVKGAPEAILQQSNLSKDAQDFFEQQSIEYAKGGYRVLGVGKGTWKEQHWPTLQEEFVFDFLGLIVFQDPPKENIVETINIFHRAGIAVKMITGDYAETAVAIAKQIKLCEQYDVLTGEQILHLSNEALRQKVNAVHIYARMFPEAKLKVIEALKDNGEIVAMTGDGVNDAPALKAAHIGIAMGTRGAEVAKSAASLILVDDDLFHMTDAVALGRKIYDNLKKAIQYIVSIHIPIILIVLLPLLLSWKFTNVFSPVHVIFLELIMGPTCSIVFENEPIEPGTMLRMPRKLSSTFLSFKQLLMSIVQGLMITAGCMGIGYYYLSLGVNDEAIRTVIFITLLCSNIFLMLTNRSFTESIVKTIRYKNNLVAFIIFITLLLLAVMLYVPFVRGLFSLSLLNPIQLLICVIVALVSTFWLEGWKCIKGLTCR